MHQGLQHQPLLGGHQQGGQLMGVMAGIEAALPLGGGHQGGEALAEALHEGLARFPRRAGGGPLQFGKQHPHQARVLLEQARMAGHESRHLFEGPRSG